MTDPAVRELRVVPMVIEDDALDESTPPAPPTEQPPADAAAKRRPWWPGLLLLLLAIAAGIVQIVAMTAAVAGDAEGATTLAWVAIVLAGVALAAGFVVAAIGWGRGFAVAAMFVAIPANPFFLLRLLEFFG